MNPLLAVIGKRALGATTICVYALGLVAAVLPHSQLGRWGYTAIGAVLGASFATVIVCAVLHLLHSLVISCARWRGSQPKEWVTTWAPDDSLPSKVATVSAYVFVFCVVVLFWIAVIAFAVHIVSFGRLGYLPTSMASLAHDAL